MKAIHEMQPTMKLRFVEREILRTVNTYSDGGMLSERVKVKILQQFWAEYDAFGAQITGEWRDVPLEVEK
jgi:hypothetical protein